MTRLPRMMAVMVAAISIACFACSEDLVLYVDGGEPGKFPLAAAQDDGAVRVYRSQLPGAAWGYVFGDSQDLTVGNLYDGAEVVSSRALLRFNLSQWSSGPLSLRILCTARVGSPIGMQVFAVSDFGALPAAGANADDVSGYWNLAELGTPIGNLTGSANGWLQLQINDSTIRQHRGADGRFAVMLTYDTKRAPGEYYTFASFEKAKAQGFDPPYLESYYYPQE
jgi:hypothetical protein